MTYQLLVIRTREQRDQLRAAIDQERRERLKAAHAIRDRDREPHPRRDYWRDYAARKRDAA